MEANGMDMMGRGKYRSYEWGLYKVWQLGARPKGIR